MQNSSKAYGPLVGEITHVQKIRLFEIAYRVKRMEARNLYARVARPLPSAPAWEQLDTKISNYVPDITYPKQLCIHDLRKPQKQNKVSPVKKIFILITALIAPAVTHAELSSGAERDTCFKKNADIPAAYNCLSAKKDSSNKTLDVLIAETVRRIKANNIGPFNGKEDSKETSGDVYNRRFLDAQKDWKAYRDGLCLSIATELDEDAYDYQSYIDQCKINLNKNHSTEIAQMGLPPAS